MTIAILTFDAHIGMYRETLLFFQRYLELADSVSILGCSGGLTRCTSLTSLGINAEKNVTRLRLEQECQKCRVKQSEFSKNIRFKLMDSLDGLNHEQEEIILRVAQLGEIDSSNLLKIEYEGVSIGKLAFYDFAMKNKIDDKVLLNKKDLIEYTLYLTDAFKVFNLIARVLSNQKIDAVLYVNGNYSLNAVAREVFSKHKVRCWSIEYSLFNTATEKRIYLEENRLIHGRSWPSFDKVASIYRCAIKDTRVALNGFSSRFKGIDHNSYSQPTRTKSWAEFDLFKARYAKLVSIFLSSSDELRVHEVVYGFQQDKRFFKDQIEWLNFLVDKSDPEIGYVIRIHPRLKPNKRDLVEAREYPKILEVIRRARKLKNFYIIDAEDPISSYFVLINSAISIVSWSTIALESVILGIPVVACFPKNMAFPIEKMSPQPKDLVEIESFIQLKAFPKREFRHEIEVLRWVNINYYSIGIRIPGVRYRRRLTAFIRSIFDRFILLSPILFKKFYYKNYKKNIAVNASDGELAINANISQSNDEIECVKLLDLFRRDIYKKFKVVFK